MNIKLDRKLNDLKNVNLEQKGIYSERILNYAIIQLLKDNQLYGNILVSIRRSLNGKLNAPLGLTWYNQKIYLLYSPILMSKIDNGDELLAILEHIAIHIIWLHPAIYHQNDLATKIGTDVAVNQYIKDVPNNTFTLQKVNSYFNLKLNKKQKSNKYIKKIKLNLKKFNKNTKKIIKLDDHNNWKRESGLTTKEKKNQLRKIVKTSWKNSNQKSRGRTPGDIVEQINRIKIYHKINWKKYIQIGLGKIDFSKINSRARFNRRQAWRMDLMGQISNNIYPVNIFVDNSGSMNNKEISFLLSEMNDFLNQFPTLINIYSFDTNIHKLKTKNNKINFNKIGGGGTRFQSIFDYVHLYHSSFDNSLIIILTDGYGEQQLNYYHFNNILWFLTVNKKEFSVKNHIGKIVSLRYNNDFENLFER